MFVSTSRICERDFGRDAQRVCLWIHKVSEEWLSLGQDETPGQVAKGKSEKFRIERNPRTAEIDFYMNKLRLFFIKK